MINASSGVIILSFIAAMILRVFPWPQDLLLYNPDWILLLVIYWSLALPDRFGVTASWLVGLFTDVLTGRLLGQYALTYAIVAYLVHKLYRRTRLAPPPQEILFVMLLSLFSQLLIFFTESFKGPSDADWTYWFPSLLGAAMWPLFRRLLEQLIRTDSPPY